MIPFFFLFQFAVKWSSETHCTGKHCVFNPKLLLSNGFILYIINATTTEVFHFLCIYLFILLSHHCLALSNLSPLCYSDPYGDPYYDYEMEAFWRGGQYENFRVQYTETPLPYHYTVSLYTIYFWQ